MSNKLLVLLAICLFDSIQSTVQLDEVLPVFDDEQILKIFHRTRSQIPKFKFANITTSTHRRKRDVRPVEIEIQGTKTQLSLTPVEHNVMSDDFPVWTVERDDTKSPYRLYRKLSPEETVENGIYYNDEGNMGVLLAQYKDQRIYYDGVYGESSQAKVVKSVLEKWWRSNAKYSDHIIYDVEHHEINTKPIIEGDGYHWKLMDKPLEIMYPKLLVVLENNLFKQLGGNVTEAIKYIGTFWNAVNLKYSKLSSPKVKIMITGIIIEKDEYTLPYIFEARNRTNLNELSSWRMLRKGGEYFKGEFHREVDFKNYDSTIIMTNLDTGIIGGQAYIGRICSDTSNIGFVNDDGSYNGVLIAVHELGHMLSMVHDGSEDAKDCADYPDPDTGTIMAPFEREVKKYIWSDCSKKMLAEFAWRQNAECLRNPYRN